MVRDTNVKNKTVNLMGVFAVFKIKKDLLART